jgi:sugar phosphate isomerase/epimerase
MSHDASRRTFLGTAALLAAGSSAVRAEPKASSLKLGLCSYSFGAKTKLADAMPFIKLARVRYINIKPEFHLPYDSSPAQIAEMKRLLDDHGLILAGTGATYLQKPDAAQIRQRFEFNKALGSPLIVIGPTVESLPLIEKCVKEFDIKVAIHNHGPSDKYFPTPESALAAIKGMDPRVGLCMDIGHTMRSGVDPVVAAREAGPRLLDIHSKDVKKNSAGQWVSADCGDGDLDLSGLFRQLVKMRFQGACNLEYEDKDDEKHGGMERSIAYLRGIAAAV